MQTNHAVTNRRNAAAELASMPVIVVAVGTCLRIIVMSPVMTTRIAFKALARNKMRTALTMLGMIIGVSAVITMVALGTGAQSPIEAQIQAGGTNMIMVSAGNFQQGGVRRGQGAAASLTPEDVEAIRRSARRAIHRAGRQYARPGHRRQHELVAPDLKARTSTCRSSGQWPIKYGAFFSPLDVVQRVEGGRARQDGDEQLFGADVDPVGQMIRISNQPFKVVGVMATKGQAAWARTRTTRSLCRTRRCRRSCGAAHTSRTSRSRRRGADTVSDAPSASRTLLRDRHKLISGDPDDFMVRTQEEMAERPHRVHRNDDGAAGGHRRACRCIVGGIGIMNIMLVSVTERTREIGMRMAIGARGRDVLLQFLVEAIVLSLFGGGIGIALGFGMAERRHACGTARRRFRPTPS